jgi:hypothetical protein
MSLPEDQIDAMANLPMRDDDEDQEMATDVDEDELDDEEDGAGTGPLSGTNGDRNTVTVSDLVSLSAFSAGENVLCKQETMYIFIMMYLIQGTLSQETLTYMIQHDEPMPYRSRRRYHWLPPGESGCRHTYPVGKCDISCVCS